MNKATKAKQHIEAPKPEQPQQRPMVLMEETLRWSGRIEIHHPVNGKHAAIVTGQGDEDGCIRGCLRDAVADILEELDDQAAEDEGEKDELLDREAA